MVGRRVTSRHNSAIFSAKIRGSGVFIRDQPQTNPEQETRPQCEIEPTDRQIDQLVYELYGLTEKENKIVEEATNK